MIRLKSSPPVGGRNVFLSDNSKFKKIKPGMNPVWIFGNLEIGIYLLFEF
jgi:hypothetical protein